MSSTSTDVLKHLASLPPWFKTKNYKGLNDMTFQQWISIILVRQLLFLNFKRFGLINDHTPEIYFGRNVLTPVPPFDDSNFIELSPLFEPESPEVEIIAEYTPPLTFLEANSVDADEIGDHYMSAFLNNSVSGLSTTSKPTLRDFEVSEQKLAENISPSSSADHSSGFISMSKPNLSDTSHMQGLNIVRSLTFDDVNLFPLLIDLAGDSPEIQQAIDLRLEGHSEYKRISFDLLMRNAGVLNNNEMHAVIDLAATDDEIFVQFGGWLKRQRKLMNFQSPKQSLSTELRLSKWKEWRIIQTMDLYIWAATEGKTISDSLMAKAVFSEASASETRDNRDVYRKSALPEIKRILTQECYDLFLNISKPTIVPPSSSAGNQ